MSPKNPRPSKESIAKKPSRKQRIAAAEQAAQKALDANYIAPIPEISPLELAHLVATMGLGDHADGPERAMTLMSRCITCIDGFKTEFERQNRIVAEKKANDAMLLAEMGLSPEKADGTFSIDEVISKMRKDPLIVEGRTLRGKPLWDEFRRQVNPQPGRPGEVREDGTCPEVYLQDDLIRVFQEYKDWRDKIARANMAKGGENLPKAIRERKKSTLTDGAEAVDAMPLPKMRQQKPQ